MNAWRGLSVLTVAVAVAVAGPALADHGGDELAFTDKTIQGKWGFSASGTIVPPALPGPTSVVAVGIMAFDGGGLCVITDTINIGGQSIFSRTSESCAYQVNPDGNGTLSAQFAGDPGPVPLSFTLVNNANKFRFIRTDLGIASGVAERQSVGKPGHRDND